MLKVKTPLHKLSLSQLSKALLLIVAGIILYRQVIPLIQLIRSLPLNDFSVYLDGIRSTVSGSNPYTQWFFDRYNYSPGATLILWPLTLLPVDLSELIFTTLSIISLWITVSLIIKSSKLSLSFAGRLLVFALVLKMFPVKLTLSLGQINLITLFLIVASFYWSQKKLPFLSGASLAIASILKLTPIPLILFYMAQKRLSIVKSFFLTFLFLSIIGIIIFGWDVTAYYYTAVIPGLLQEVSQETVRTDYMNQGITALLGRFNIFGLPSSLIRYLVSGTLLGVLTFKSATAKSVAEKLKLFSLLIITVKIFLPTFVWQHHFVFLLPAWLLLAICSLKQPRTWLTPTAILSYLLINFYFKDPNLPVQQHPLITTHFLLVAIVIFIATFNLPQNLLDSKQK